MKGSLNDIEAQIAALERGSAADSDESDASDIESIASDPSEAESGYSCDSSSTEESDYSDESDEKEPVTEEEKRKAEFDKKANVIARKKARQGMSDLCFKFLVGKCRVDNCILRHSTLESLDEEEKGELVRELHRKPFEAELGKLIKDLNIPTCKTFSKQGECKFAKCKFWHIETENAAQWAGYPFWCESCWKAFTSETQLREHNNGKLHKSSAAYWAASTR